MRLRLLAFGLILIATMLTSGCLFYRPCGWHRRCCASPVSGAPTLAAPAAGPQVTVAAKPGS
jgi:hypothetical protein